MFYFPFAAVVGQQDVKLALILLAVDPSIGGVLVSGPRGSAKSTLARSMAGLNIQGLKQLVTLPLGASEEMLTGTLDLQQALQNQQVNFAPGLLSKAHEGLLYVDEVNLLPDGLVDLLLDVAASGVNYVERDGISHEHAANFVLMGTMNPDEGELRPQLLDRFGLMANLDNHFSAAERVEIVRRRQAFDADPAALLDQFAEQQHTLCASIQAAQQTLHGVEICDQQRLEIAERCAAAHVDGLRADLVWAKAACAHSALRGAQKVTTEDIDAVASLVLRHRRQTTENSPKNPPPSSTSEPPPFQRPPFSGSGHSSNAEPTDQQNHNNSAKDKSPQDSSGQWGQMPPQTQVTGQALASRLLKHIQANLDKPAVGANQEASQGHRQQGRGQEKKQLSKRINWFASLAAGRGHKPKLRFRRQRGGDPVMHVILLDTSASTLKDQGQALAKSIVEGLTQSAYLARQKVFLLGFGNDQVALLHSQERPPKSIKPMLDKLPAGGGTPLAQTLEQARSYGRQWLRRNPATQIVNYLITDGRVKGGLCLARLPGKSLLIDTERSTVKRGHGSHIAQLLGAEYLSVSQLQPASDPK